MNLDELNHPYTPKVLGKINQRIVELLQSPPDIDVPALNALLQERDEVIKAHMDALDEDALRAFASSEIKVNDNLTKQAEGWLASAKNDVTQFVRSQVAIKKYK
ncbi:hypothetical protein [Alteromonas sp. KUL49]|uniref:hypothetical protein n=1 Tax=Alteromonas sp. KUL49 TaxID=2480798 RepID=UPI00102F00CF|nr:hypothetical protein [Alteromonas sp. KUL49]TAP39666.1 hypothetical protein EYS00_10055 [Alteromonas sp. KUL49]GEA11651.1 hypothetical protein KUL49_20260 [Alteromonas sp. KUL49]